MTTLQALFVGFVAGAAVLRVAQVIAEAIWRRRMDRRADAIVYHWTNVRALRRELSRHGGSRN